MKLPRCFVLIFITHIFFSDAQANWTWLLRKEFNNKDFQQISGKKSCVVQKTSLKPFHQLIFCWNGFRPEKGFFLFEGQVRDFKTQQWHPMHRMIEWGNNRQRSYYTPGTVSNYHHVRLELPKEHLADGFRIRIEAQEEASLDLLQSIAITLSRSDALDLTLIANYEGLPSVMAKNVPQYSQMVLNHERADSMCSPTACSMLLGYVLSQPINVVDMALKSYDHGLDSFGSWPFNMAHAFDASRGAAFFTVTRLPSFKALHSYLVKNIPVAVSIRGSLVGGAKSYDNGHLIVVVGWDHEKKQVICHDPAFVGDDRVMVAYDIQEFCHAWMRSRCLTYLVEPRFLPAL